MFYLAPLEGITGYIFRNAFNEYFGEGVDKYYTPFIMPHVKRAFSDKELNEVLPANNPGMNLVPQILTDNADDFTRVKNEFRQLGYSEINLNLGCPSRTVTTKGRGAAMLSKLTELDRFLDGIFADGDENISIKTRIGVSEPEEFSRIIEVYIKYPIKELIIHPRVLEEMYKGKPHRDVFIETLKQYDKPICYNGDIFDAQDYVNLEAQIKECAYKGSVNYMLGRGVLRSPSLIRELSGGKRATNEEIYNMLCKLREGYYKSFSGQTPVLFKMKEIWSYLSSSYPNDDKLIKKLMKSKSLSEYDTYVKMILR